MLDALESTIANIWEEILGVKVVESDHDFFELGGTSFHAARVVTKTRAALGVKLSAQMLFEHSTRRPPLRSIPLSPPYFPSSRLARASSGF